MFHLDLEKYSFLCRRSLSRQVAFRYGTRDVTLQILVVVDLWDILKCRYTCPEQCFSVLNYFTGLKKDERNQIVRITATLPKCAILMLISGFTQKTMITFC